MKPIGVLVRWAIFVFGGHAHESSIGHTLEGAEGGGAGQHPGSHATGGR